MVSSLSRDPRACDGWAGQRPGSFYHAQRGVFAKKKRQPSLLRAAWFPHVASRKGGLAMDSQDGAITG